MGARGTYKACPGCGEDGFRNVNEVCNLCKKLIEDGRKYRNYIETEKKKKENIMLICPDSWCAPRTYLSGLFHYDHSDEVIGECLRDLANELSIEAGRSDYSKKVKFHLYRRKAKSGYIKNPFNWRHCRIMDKRIAGLLHRLWFAIDKTMNLVHDESVQYGKSILRQLAKGDMSIIEFDGKE